MGEEKKRVEAPQQPTYDELKNYCNQLLMQRNQVAEKLNRVTNVLNKLPWLFEVVKAKECFDPDFVNSCIKEIEEIMTPPPVDEDIKEENKE